MGLSIPLFLAVLSLLLFGRSASADDPPLTRNVPIDQFQNRTEDVKPYNFDAPPEGMFYSIATTEGFEEELGYRRAHEYVPVNPTEVFAAGPKPVYIVFRVYPHYESFQIFGRCYPEDVDGLDSKYLITEDIVYMALEDDTGYLTFQPPAGGWKPGKYKVEIHVGWKVNDFSLIGTMRFAVQPNAAQNSLSESK
jgi:hypothetical protein